MPGKSNRNKEPQVSIAPDGEEFPIPQAEEYAAEFTRIGQLASNARKEGKEIVVVMGVGFVGAVMAAIIADARDRKGRNSKFVIGCQRPSSRSYWKIPLLMTCSSHQRVQPAGHRKHPQPAQGTHLQGTPGIGIDKTVLDREQVVQPPAYESARPRHDCREYQQSAH